MGQKSSLSFEIITKIDLDIVNQYVKTTSYNRLRNTLYYRK